MNRISDLLPQRAAAPSIAILGSGVLFGVSHISQGLSGVISNFLGGLVYGILYVSGGWNLWVPILAHGLEDTIGFVLIFLGRYPGL
jgi:membrane protease YdiL (CAAX protease family)